MRAGWRYHVRWRLWGDWAPAIFAAVVAAVGTALALR